MDGEILSLEGTSWGNGDGLAWADVDSIAVPMAASINELATARPNRERTNVEGNFGVNCIMRMGVSP